MQKIEIIRANNGYIVKNMEERDEGEFIELFNVFQESAREFDIERYKTDDEEKIALAKLLEWVAEHFGETYQKFDKDNMAITFDRVGHKISDE